MPIEVNFIDPNKPAEKKKKRSHGLESDLSTAIISKFNSIKNVRCQKVKGTVFGQPTLDIVGSRSGRFFWLEVKQPGKKPTLRQYNTMKKWIDDGAIATWTTDLEGAMRFLLSDWTKLSQADMLGGFHGKR